jgi:branched-chain amino acid transport system substrate-binding protein
MAARWSRTSRRYAAVVAAVGLATTLAACAGGESAGGAGGADCSPTIPVGGITPISGALAPAYAPFADGLKARIAYQNDNGGINGRPIELFVSDDASDPARNLAAARELVEGRDVVGVVQASSFTAGGADYLERENVAVTGYSTSSEFITKPNFFGYSNTAVGGNVLDKTSRVWGEFLKQKGATSVFGLGSGTKSGQQGAMALVRSATAAGITEGGVALNLPPGTTNYAGEVQKARAAGVDALALSTPPGQTLAFLDALRQAGVSMKAVLMTIGYDPQVLATPGMDGATAIVPFAPFELKLPAHQTYKDAMAQYADPTRIGQMSMGGWLGGDLMVTALQAAGTCPTREGLLKTLPTLRGYTADGLVPPTDFTPETHGTPPLCSYFVTVRNGAFINEGGDKPICTANAQSVPI